MGVAVAGTLVGGTGVTVDVGGATVGGTWVGDGVAVLQLASKNTASKVRTSKEIFVRIIFLSLEVWARLYHRHRVDAKTWHHQNQFDFACIR
jgi:hypothetical protein